MTEIVTSRVSAGIYPAAADVGRTLSNGNNNLTIPSEYSGLLTGVTYTAAGEQVIREEGGRRFVALDDPTVTRQYGFYTITAGAAIRASGAIRFDLRIVGWDRIATALAAVNPGGFVNVHTNSFSPEAFLGFSAVINRAGSLGLLCRPYKGRIMPWVYCGDSSLYSAQDSSPLPERVITGEWIPCELRLLRVSGVYQLVLLMDGVAVYTTRTIGSYGSSGFDRLFLFNPVFRAPGTTFSGVALPYIQLANIEYTYTGTADMAPPAVSIAGDVGDTSARLTAEVTLG